MPEANLGLRFGLELATLGAVSLWGFEAGSSILTRFVLAIGLPMVVAVVWGAFVAPKARFRVSRVAWYALQFVIFGAAALAFASLWSPVAGIAFAVVALENLAFVALAGETR